MIVLVTGATGLIGSAVATALLDRGDEVRGTTRDAAKAAEREPRIEWFEWDPAGEPLPTEAALGADGVIHLAGEEIAQRWNGAVKRRIRDSRVAGTRNLVAGIARAENRPGVLVSQSGVGYYGDRDADRLSETEGPGDDFLASVCVDWEAEARKAEDLGMRVVQTRTGVVLSADGGALATMIPPFKLGVGGPVGSGRQYMAWIHLDDVVGLLLWAVDNAELQGPVNVSAPEPATNKELSKALGRALRRPAIMPVPPLALKAMYGQMSQVVTGSQRAIPERALELGYDWRFPDLDPAMRDAVG